MNDNISKANEIAQNAREKVADERGKSTVYTDYDFQETLNIGYYAAKEMAELKDKVIKQFFIEHICPDMKVETNEEGQPLANSYIEVQQKRFELAEEMFNRYKEFEFKNVLYNGI